MSSYENNYAENVLTLSQIEKGRTNVVQKYRIQ